MKKIFLNFIASSILLLLLTFQAQATSVSTTVDDFYDIDSFTEVPGSHAEDAGITYTQYTSSEELEVIINHGGYEYTTTIVPGSFSVTTSIDEFLINQGGGSLRVPLDKIMENIHEPIPDPIPDPIPAAIPDPYTEVVSPTIDNNIIDTVIQDVISDNSIINTDIPDITITEVKPEYEPHEIETVTIDVDVSIQDTLFVQVRKRESVLVDPEVFEEEADLEDSIAFKDLVGNDVVTKYVLAKVKLQVEINKLKEQLNDKEN